MRHRWCVLTFLGITLFIPIHPHDTQSHKISRTGFRQRKSFRVLQTTKDYLAAVASIGSLVKNHPFKSAVFSFGVGGVAQRNRYAAGIMCVAALHIRKNQLIHDAYLKQLRAQVYLPASMQEELSEPEEDNTQASGGGWFYRNFPVSIRQAAHTISWCINATARGAIHTAKTVNAYKNALLSIGPLIKKHPAKTMAFAASVGGVWAYQRDVAIALMASSLVAYKHHHANKQELAALLRYATNLQEGATFDNPDMQCSYCGHPKVLPIYCFACGDCFCQDCGGDLLFCPHCNGTLCGGYRTVHRDRISTENKLSLTTKNQISSAFNNLDA